MEAHGEEKEEEEEQQQQGLFARLFTCMMTLARRGLAVCLRQTDLVEEEELPSAVTATLHIHVIDKVNCCTSTSVGRGDGDGDITVTDGGDGGGREQDSESALLRHDISDSLQRQPGTADASTSG
jgi:hypothetical protein